MKSMDFTKASVEKAVEAIKKHGEELDAIRKEGANLSIEEIAQKHPDQTVLIVTHGVVLRSLYIYFKRWDMKDASNQPKPQSTCLCDIRKEAGVWDIKMWNDTEHLNDLVSANTHPFI